MGARAIQMPEQELRVADESARIPGEEGLPAWMVRYQQGDPAAVEQLVGWLSPHLMRYFAASGLSRPDVEDLFQETWIRIHRSRQTYRPTEPLLPWIYAIARHSRLDFYRRRRRRESREVLVSEPFEVGFQPPEPLKEEQSDVSRLLEGLPPSQREVIFMLKVSGMSLEEVARATSSTVGAIKQKAHRAYGTLRRLLEKEAH
jgi:RNA polymerase sigma-70 factor (ECF subfamily)